MFGGTFAATAFEVLIYRNSMQSCRARGGSGQFGREFERVLLHKDDGRMAGDGAMGSMVKAWGIGKVKDDSRGKAGRECRVD